MYQTILLPLDGSPFSAKALPVAAAMAKRTGATVHVVTVLDPSAYVPFVPGEVLVPVMDTDALATRRAADLDAIRDVADGLAKDGVTAVGTLLEGTVVEALAEHATTIGADLVIMTTHGRSGLERLWLGSVTSSFLHRAPCPVFLVRPAGAAAPTTSAPLPGGPILVPLDGSTFGDAIIPRATSLANSLGSHLTLFTVTIPNTIPVVPFGTEAILADGSDLTKQEHAARTRLEAMLSSMPAGSTAEVATDMTPASAIIEKAESTGAGVIAMATHGRTGITRLLMGSVADAVVRGASQAVLLYRPTQDESQG